MPNTSSPLDSLLRGTANLFGKSRLPKISGTLNIKGPEAPVEILRDRWGVPHIYAQNNIDLIFAQGFVHAQERLFQMELNRRTAQGTLSELFGPIALETDRTVRTFGFNRLGRIDWSGINEESKGLILAYCAGVNAFIDHPTSKLPLEFSLLNHRPGPWRPHDVTAFARVMMWQLSHSWFGEITRLLLVEAVGEEHASELEIAYPLQNPLVLPDGIEFNRLEEGKLVKDQGPFLRRGLGSNSWTVSGSKTANGHNYLCNDMHLVLGIPGTWIQNHLEGGDFHATGVSLPGAPGILVGHNDRIAWGMTLAFNDCEDLYMEEFHPEIPEYVRFDNDWYPAEAIEEPIQIKGQAKPHIERVLVTRHGPIISDVVGYTKASPKKPKYLAVRSMALRPGPSLSPWLALDRAQGWDDFVIAMRGIEAPQLSVNYADVDGNIGYWVTGRTPIRGKGNGRLPSPGWDPEYEWTAEVPFEEMPHAFNPRQGFTVHTNNRIVGDDYPYFLGSSYMNGYRARRISDVLQSSDKLTPVDFNRLQTDFTSLPGRELVRKLAGFQSSNADVQLALEILNEWDGVLSKESTGGTVYSVARYCLSRALFEPGLGAELTTRFMGQGFNPVLFQTHEFLGQDTIVLLRMLDDADSWWVNQAGGRQALIERGLEQAIQWLRANLGIDPLTWQWGRLHGAVFAHPLGLQKPLDRIFNRGPFPIGGDTDTPCQTAYNPANPYDNTAWSPSFRQIVDMGDLSKSLVIAPPGQSGHSTSPHYDDLIQPWLQGEYLPQLWTRQQVEEYLDGKLEIKP